MSRTLKATALICILCLLLAVPAMASFNKVYYLGDFLVAKTVNTYDVNYTFQIPSSPTILLFSGGKLNATGGSGKWYDVNFSNGIQDPEFRVYPIGQQISSVEQIPRNVIDITDFKPETVVSFSTSFTIRFTFGYTQAAFGAGTLPISGYYIIYCYDADGTYIAAHTTGHFHEDLNVPDASGYVDPNVGSVATYPFSSTQSVLIPDDCAYIVPAISFYFENADQSQPFYVDSCQPVYNNMTIRVKESAILVQSELMKDISSKLDGVDDQLGDLNDKADQILQQPEQEKQEASSGGQDAADQLAGAIPDQSQGFMDAIQDLVSSMSYDGTEAKMTFPSITLPAIPGVMPSYKLSEPYDVDFGVWIQRMPEKLMRLVQVLGTLALVVYSFKELYGMISYAMTLKGGGSDG